MRKSITKEEVNLLENKSFEGNIMVVDREEQLQEAITLLSNETILGFDTETRPSFKKNVRYDTSLLQLSTHTHAFLFRLQHIGLPKEIIQLFENKNIKKIGVAISNDLKELKSIQPFRESNFIDLNTFAPKKGFKNIGVRKLSAMVLGFRVSKRQQTSNWEAETLSDAQMAYAATDAWVCREIYLKIKGIMNGEL